MIMLYLRPFLWKFTSFVKAILLKKKISGLQQSPPIGRTVLSIDVYFVWDKQIPTERQLDSR